MNLGWIILILLFSISFCTYIHIILHELGHFLFGLIEKNKFYALGIGNNVLIKENGKIKIKNHEISGYGGYCIMIPPKPKNNEIPYFWVLAGGSILNIISSIAVLLLILFIPLNEIIYYFSIVFVILGFYAGIINLLPLKISVGSDGCKILSLYKNKQARKYLYDLRIATIKLFEGIQIKDLPQNILAISDDVNFNNPILASIRVIEADRYWENEEYEKAVEKYKSLLTEDIKLTNVNKNNILCQLLYFEIMKGNEEEAHNLMTKKLKKYIKSSYNLIDKKRLMYAYTVLIEKDVEKSEEIWYDFHDACEKNLNKSEVESESEMMDYIGELGIEKGIL